MSNNETLPKIVTLFLLINLVLPASVPDANDLYGRFTNRLEEVANFAESEFKKSTSETLRKIYEMNAKIVQEQIAERKNAAEILKFHKSDQTKSENIIKSSRQDKIPSGLKTVNITLKFLPPTEGVVDEKPPKIEKHEVKADELEFEFPTGDRDLQLDMQLRDEPTYDTRGGFSRKREPAGEFAESRALDEFINEMSAPAVVRNVNANCNCGCENCRSFTRVSSEKVACNCNCGNCNKCKRNKMFNYSRKFHKRFQGKSKRDALPFAYPTEDVYTKVLSTPYNPVMLPDNTLEKLLRMNFEMPGGNHSFIEGVGINVLELFPTPSTKYDNASPNSIAKIDSRGCAKAPKPPPSPQNTPSAPGYQRIGPPNSSQELPPSAEGVNETTLCQITNVLEKLFGEVEQLKYSNSSENPPNNAPCDVTGSWNSETINLRFDIHQATAMDEKALELDIYELDPPSPRPKYFIDCEFKGGRGEFLKKIGGPFYIMAYKSSESLLATFAGICKSCNGVDTLFGEWTFVSPARDCSDCLMTVNSRRDVMRRYSMDVKKKMRMDFLHPRNSAKKSHCC